LPRAPAPGGDDLPPGAYQSPSHRHIPPSPPAAMSNEDLDAMQSRLESMDSLSSLTAEERRER